MISILANLPTEAVLDHSHEKVNTFKSLFNPLFSMGFLVLLLIIVLTILLAVTAWRANFKNGLISQVIAGFGAVTIVTLAFWGSIHLSDVVNQSDLDKHLKFIEMNEEVAKTFNDADKKEANSKYGVILETPLVSVKDLGLTKITDLTLVTEPFDVVSKTGEKITVTQSRDDFKTELKLFAEGKELPITENYTKAMKLRAEADELLKSEK